METSKTSTIFIGSGSFAVEILDRLLKLDLLEVKAVITQPDKQAGREQALRANPVKSYLLEKKSYLKLYQPEKIKAAANEILEAEKPALIIVADYGQILPETIINYPRFKCLNVHGSLLPDLRGAVPIPMAILKGYTQTGVSIPIMTKGLDDGSLLASKTLDIAPADNTFTLKVKLAKLGANLLAEVLPVWLSDKLNPQPQSEEEATYCYEKDLAKENAYLNPTISISLANNMVRAFNPWPIVWSLIKINGKNLRLKIFKAEQIAKLENVPVGQLSKVGNHLFLNFNDGALELLEVQLEGKNRGTTNDYLFLDKSQLQSMESKSNP